MPAGRPNRPLFDLIAEEGDEARRRGTAPSTATPAVELKPPPATVRAREQVAIERPETPARTRTAPRGLWGSLVSTGRATVEITTPWFAAGVAVLLALLLGTWIIAYKVGESEATRRLAGGVSTAPPRPQDSAQPDQLPVIIPNFATRPPEPRAERLSSAEVPGVTPEQPAPSPAVGDLPAATPGDTGPVVAYTGTYETDPRVVGRNYLILASNMSRSDARHAVDFLGQNGFRALGVPYGSVDRSSRAGKNDPLYKLVSAEGFDGSEMKESQARRDRMAEEVQRLGQVYQRQHRGKYNFAKVNWEKYVR